jgi:hypothetical protein
MKKDILGEYNIDNDPMFINLTNSIYTNMELLMNFVSNPNSTHFLPSYSASYTWSYALLTLWQKLVTFLSEKNPTYIPGNGSCAAGNLWLELNNQYKDLLNLGETKDSFYNFAANWRSSEFLTFFNQNIAACNRICNTDLSNSATIEVLYNLIATMTYNCETSNYIMTCSDDALINIADNLVTLYTLGCPYDTNANLDPSSYLAYCHDPFILFLRAYLSSPIYPSDVNSTLFIYASNYLNGSDTINFQTAFNYLTTYSSTNQIVCNLNNLKLSHPNPFVCILANIYNNYMNFTNKALPTITTQPLNFTPPACGILLYDSTGSYIYTNCPGNSGVCDS